MVASAPLPRDLEAQTNDALSRLGSIDDPAPAIIVRSSACIEDVAGANAPGVYRSLKVPFLLSDVLDAIRLIWLSTLSPDAIKYRRRAPGASHNPGIGVVVQRFIRARLGGALSTIDSASNDASRVIVAWSTDPSRLLSGEDPGKNIAIRKRDGAGSEACPSVIENLVNEARGYERELNRPLEIEFAVDRSNVAYLLQCRTPRYIPAWRKSRIMIGPVHQQKDLSSPKIAAARLGYEALGEALEQIVIRPSLFDAYRRERVLSLEMRADLVRAIDPLCERGALGLRPAYWSALHSADNLPQGGSLSTTEACIDRLLEFWSHIIEQGLDDYSSEVAAIVGNWLPVVASAVTSAGPDTAVAEMDVVMGYPEGLEALPFETLTVDRKSRFRPPRRTTPRPLRVLSLCRRAL
jgi:hypothetical protein